MSDRGRRKGSAGRKPKQAAKGGSALRPSKVKSVRSFSTEYSLLLTATMILIAFGVVMVFSASSTSQTPS